MSTARAKKAAAWANIDGAVTLKHNPYQVAFLDALDQRINGDVPAYNVLSLFAGRRGGKTEIGSVAIPKLIARKPKQWGWVCAPTYRDIHDVVMPLTLSRIPASWISDWSAEHLTLLTTNQTRLQFRSLENPNTARGPGLDFAWIDEAREVAQLAWHTMMPALADKNGVAIVTTSPNGYDWTYSDFWKPAAEGMPGFWSCKYPTNVNPKMQEPAQAALIEMHRKMMDPLFFRQEYEADFVTFAGAVYGSTVNHNLLLTTTEQVREFIPEWPLISPDRELILGMDPGADHPFAVVFLVTTEKGIVQVAEYKHRNATVLEHWQRITEILHSLNPQQQLEPAMIAGDRSQRQTIIEFQRMGINLMPAENDVIAGIRRCSTWFGSGHFKMVADRTPETFKQLQSYRWNEQVSKKGERLQERVIKVDDDLPDALRYGLMMHPSNPLDFETSASSVLLSDADPYAWEKYRRKRIAEAEREREAEVLAMFEPGGGGETFTEFWS